MIIVTFFPVFSRSVCFVPNFSVCVFLFLPYNNLWLFEFAVIVVYFRCSFFTLFSLQRRIRIISTLCHTFMHLGFFPRFPFNSCVFSSEYAFSLCIFVSLHGDIMMKETKKKYCHKIVKEFGFIWFLCMRIYRISLISRLSHT